MYRATLEDYLTGVAVIEEEFGLGWLQKKARIATQPSHRGWHPVPKDWKDVKAALEGFESTGILQPSQALIGLTSFGYDIRLARPVPNYDIAIRPRLKKSREFPKVQYEVYVAALCVRSGYNAEFIPPSTTAGEKSPDLKVLTEGCEVYVECVRKEAYRPQSSIQDGVWKSLWQRMSATLDGLGASHEVIVIALGALKEESFPAILHVVKQHILASREGIWVIREVGCGLAIRRMPPQPTGQGVSLFIPAGMNPAFTFGSVAVDGQGQKYLKNVSRIALYAIDSHRLGSILSSVNEKRGQIPEGGPGLVYLDLDVSHVAEADVPAYLELVAAAIKSLFTPNANTRIGAVVLTTGAVSVFIETVEDTGPFITLHRRIRVIRNPCKSLPDGFVVPGERI